MADLKERFLLNNISERSDLPATTQTYHPGQPHEMSPESDFMEQSPQIRGQFLDHTTQKLPQQIPQTSPVPQKRQFLHPASSIKPSVSLPAQHQPTTPPVSTNTAQKPLPQPAPPISQIVPQSVLAIHQQQTLLPPVSGPFLPLQQPFMAATSHTTQTVSRPLPLPLPPPLMPVPMPSQKSLPGLKKRKKTRVTRGKKIRRVFVVLSILTIITVVFMSQANGESGAWTADMLRSVLGPSITAQVESWYLGLSDTTHQLQYNLSGQHVAAPWTVGTVTPLSILTAPPKTVLLSPMPLGRITPMVSPALPGEGTWATQGIAPSPYGYLPLDAKAFIRPDPSHPYAIVTLLQFDTRFFKLHMVAGTIEPGGPRGFNGPGLIPAADQKGNALLAAFNGGFKYADGQYGLKTNGIVYVPAQQNAATIAMTKSGQIIMGAWGVDPRLNSGNTNLVAWRQNAALLIDNGKINPLTQDGAAWGGTILNAAYTWRSGIGLTAHGTLIYAAGSFLTALTLGEALRAAGAVTAMQTDINPFWVRAFLYSRDSQGTLNIIKLNPAMYGTGNEYLSATERDFFYMTRYSPPPPPQPQRETNSQ
jgi:hypothetical protein